jgi:ABC-type phosphate transport system substrate-binding protein
VNLRIRNHGFAAAALAMLGACIGGCGDAGDGGSTVRVDGSSTVGSLTQAVSEDFQIQSSATVTIGIAGTGGGFEKFCVGAIDISDASRSIERDEQSVCEENGVAYTEIPVANDRRLRRPLFIYVSRKSVKKSEVADFVRFYRENLDTAVAKARLVPLTAEQKERSDREFEEALRAF